MFTALELSDGGNLGLTLNAMKRAPGNRILLEPPAVLTDKNSNHRVKTGFAEGGSESITPEAGDVGRDFCRASRSRLDVALRAQPAGLPASLRGSAGLRPGVLVGVISQRGRKWFRRENLDVF